MMTTTKWWFFCRSKTGMSAGGNLAAALSMKIRDSNLTWKFKLQILGVPCLQAYRFDTPSYNQNNLDEILSRPSMTNYWLWYAFGSEGHLLLDDFLEGRFDPQIISTDQSLNFVFFLFLLWLVIRFKCKDEIPEKLINWLVTNSCMFLSHFLLFVDTKRSLIQMENLLLLLTGNPLE